MRFQIDRASTAGDDTLPVPEAVQEPGGWHIDVPSLEALMAFMEREGKIIIYPTDPPLIRIYDDYID